MPIEFVPTVSVELTKPQLHHMLSCIGTFVTVLAVEDGDKCVFKPADLAELTTMVQALREDKLTDREANREDVMRAARDIWEAYKLLA